MNRLLLVLPALLFVFGVNYAYAESSDGVIVTILEYGENIDTVRMTWNADNDATKYEVGCVSCMPNISEFSSETSITLNDVTQFPNTSNAMLYLIAYDSQDEIIHAEQIIVNLAQ
ncbi:MAG: hypothetical protein ACRBB2_00270 [Nitrosopumilus sp.]